MNKPAAEACIFRNCGFSNRAVKSYLGELRDAVLVAETNGHYLASEPSADCRQWSFSDLTEGTDKRGQLFHYEARWGGSWRQNHDSKNTNRMRLPRWATSQNGAKPDPDSESMEVNAAGVGRRDGGEPDSLL
jgi:hypothetical protein